MNATTARIASGTTPPTTPPTIAPVLLPPLEVLPTLVEPDDVDEEVRVLGSVLLELGMVELMVFTCLGFPSGSRPMDMATLSL